MIVYCCQDLLFATRIGSTAEHLGLTARPARQLPQLQARLDQVDDGKPNGPVSLVLVDLAMESVAISLIRLARANGAARANRTAQAQAPNTAPRIVAFGSHVDAQALNQARQAGADLALPRSRFVQQLVPLLQQANTPAPGSASGPALATGSKPASG